MRYANLSIEQLIRIGMGLAFFAAAPFAHGGSNFTLRSTAFEEGAKIPVRYGGNFTSITPNCIGQNVSPSLKWSNSPIGTKSYALVLSDPEASNGLGLVHWIAYGIPASRTGFVEGEVSDLSDKFVMGKNSFGTGQYVGPCAPAGAMHHYTFVLIATDLAPTALERDLTWDKLRSALKGHALGATGLVGLYAKP